MNRLISAFVERQLEIVRGVIMAYWPRLMTVLSEMKSYRRTRLAFFKASERGRSITRPPSFFGSN